MVTVASARRFLEAFSAAVHDVKLENVGYGIYHHFDSDFLIRMIFGYRDTINRALISGRSIPAQRGSGSSGSAGR